MLGGGGCLLAGSICCFVARDAAGPNAGVAHAYGWGHRLLSEIQANIVLCNRMHMSRLIFSVAHLVHLPLETPPGRRVRQASFLPLLPYNWGLEVDCCWLCGSSTR